MAQSFDSEIYLGCKTVQLVWVRWSFHTLGVWLVFSFHTLGVWLVFSFHTLGVWLVFW
jgi:hypothetical protein